MTSAVAHGREEISPWVRRWTHLVPDGGEVLDLACGYGRHARWFATRGHAVTAVDRDADAIASLATGAGAARITGQLADIENDAWPLQADGGPRRFNAVVVTNYLWRDLLPTIVDSVAPGGVLLYETFAAGNASVGKPSRPDFLLQTGELLRACADLRVVAYEDGFCDRPERFVQRIAAVREAKNPAGPLAPAAAPRRYPL